MKFISEIRVAGRCRSLHVDLTEGAAMRIREGQRLIDKGVFSEVGFEIAADLCGGGAEATRTVVSVNVSKDDFWFSVYDDVMQSDESSPAFSFEDLNLFKSQDVGVVFNVEYFEGFDAIERLGPMETEYLVDKFCVDQQELCGIKIGIKSVFIDETRVIDVLPDESMRLLQQRS